jgi:TRAP transporter TatT component family protein/tripartite ATP-independent transporter DctM subunit
MIRGVAFLLLSLAVVTDAGCSLKTYAVNKVGDTLASGESVYETDDDIELIGQALPFGLKLTESLLAQSPKHRGLLLTACRGFVLYSYSYVEYEAELMRERDLDRALAMRARAHRLYLRGARYGFRALDTLHPGFEAALASDPAAAVASIGNQHAARDVPLLYWTTAALGLASRRREVMPGCSRVCPRSTPCSVARWNSTKGGTTARCTSSASSSPRRSPAAPTPRSSRRTTSERWRTPLAAAYGIHPVHLGIIFLANMELGYLMPPMGKNLFLAAYRFNRPLGEVYRATVPYTVMLLAAVLVITYVPALTLWLVKLWQ